MIAKKVIIIALATVMFLLAGCGVSDNKGNEKSFSVTAEKSKTDIATSTPSTEASKQPDSSAAATGAASKEEQKILDSFIKEEAPDFTLEDKDGNKVTLSALKGTPVVLNFWATWCPYCVGEFGIFSQAQNKFPQIKFYGIDTNENMDLTDKNNRKANEDFARGKGFELPILFDAGGEVFNGKYATQGLPSTFLIDADGNVRAGFDGAMPDYQSLETVLNAFLKVN